jgi:tyrosine-protein kinase Etk/Wzc
MDVRADRAVLPKAASSATREAILQETTVSIPEFSVFDLLTTLASRKKFILAWTVGASLAVGGMSFLLPPQFTATLTLLPPQQSSSSGAAALAQLGGLSMLGQGGLGIKSPVDLYVSLLRGNNVEEAMIQRFDLAKEFNTKHKFETLKVLESKVGIEANPKDGLIRLAVTDANPARAAELANGYVEEFRKLSSKLAISEASQRRLFFEQQLDQQKDNLIAAEEALKQTQQTTGLVALDAQARTLIQSIASQRAQIAAKEVQISGMRIYAAAGNTDLILAEKELQSLRGELARQESANGESNLNGMGKLPQAGLDYVRKSRQVKYNETLFEILARQYEAARLDEAKEGAPIQVVDPATTPDHRSGPKRLYYSLFGFVMGAFISVLFVIFQTAMLRNDLLAKRYTVFRQALLGR